MFRENKVQIMTDKMPLSFFITREEYAQIYPEERTPRRIGVTFNHFTKTAWVDEKLAEFIIQSRPEVRYYKREYTEPPDNTYHDNIVEVKTDNVPKRIAIEVQDYAELYPNEKIPRQMMVVFQIANRVARVDKVVADYLVENYRDIHYVNQPVKEPEKEDEKPKIEVLLPDNYADMPPNVKFETLKAIGWTSLPKELREEYKALKEVANDRTE